jgi:hypothetical protein
MIKPKPAFLADGSCGPCVSTRNKTPASIPEKPRICQEQEQTNLHSAEAAKCHPAVAANGPCDKAAPAAAVMLHLRSRYVSKAAILTIPIPPRIGRKSKSRLNSKGLDRLAPLFVATVFPLRV